MKNYTTFHAKRKFSFLSISSVWETHLFSVEEICFQSLFCEVVQKDVEFFSSTFPTNIGKIICRYFSFRL